MSTLLRHRRRRTIGGELCLPGRVRRGRTIEARAVGVDALRRSNSSRGSHCGYVCQVRLRECAVIHGARLQMGSASCGRRACYHAAILNVGRGRRDSAIDMRPAEVTGAVGRNAGAIGDPGIAQGSFIDGQTIIVNGLAIDETVARGGGNGMNVVRVGVVIEIAVVDDVDVADVSVSHVHVVPVTRTAVIPRVERLSPT